MNQEPDTKKLLIKVAIDVTCLLLVVAATFCYFVFGEPYERGFFCEDNSIRKPYLKSTIPSWALYMIGFGFPVIVIVAVELCNYYSRKDEKIKIKLMSRMVPIWLLECYKHIGLLLFGAACTILATDLAKYTLGRLRPHFFDVCIPDVECEENEKSPIYFTNYRCLGQDEKLIKDSKLSFPSGHSSFAAFCMLYIALYLQVKMTWKGSALFKFLLQFIFVLSAIYVAFTRINDYKHHWSDVLAGLLLGFLIAFLVAVFVSDLWSQKPRPKEREIEDKELSEVEPSQGPRSENRDTRRSQAII